MFLCCVLITVSAIFVYRINDTIRIVYRINVSMIRIVSSIRYTRLRATTKSLTCPPLSIARYSFIQLSQLGRQWRERKCPIFGTVAEGDSNPGSLDFEYGILPLSYRAPAKRINRDRNIYRAPNPQSYYFSYDIPTQRCDPVE